jgi:hypothetical protein
MGQNLRATLRIRSNLMSDHVDPMFSAQVKRDLVTFLVEHPDMKVVPIDWGNYRWLHIVAPAIDVVGDQLIWLLDDRGDSAYITSRVRAILRKSNLFYLAHAPQATILPRARKRFFEEVQRSGLRLRLDHTVQWSVAGQPVLEIYRVVERD